MLRPQAKPAQEPKQLNKSGTNIAWDSCKCSQKHFPLIDCSSQVEWHLLGRKRKTTHGKRKQNPPLKCQKIPPSLHCDDHRRLKVMQLQHHQHQLCHLKTLYRPGSIVKPGVSECMAGNDLKQFKMWIHTIESCHCQGGPLLWQLACWFYVFECAEDHPWNPRGFNGTVPSSLSTYCTSRCADKPDQQWNRSVR